MRVIRHPARWTSVLLVAALLGCAGDDDHSAGTVATTDSRPAATEAVPVTSDPTPGTTAPPAADAIRPPVGEEVNYATAAAFDPDAGIVVAAFGSQTWRFDVEAEVWTRSRARAPFGAIGDRGLVYVPSLGAVLAVGGDGSVSVYDPAADEWRDRPGPSIPDETRWSDFRPAIVGVDEPSGDVFVFGSDPAHVWRYDVAGSSWILVEATGGPEPHPNLGGPLVTYDPRAGGFVYVDYGSHMYGAERNDEWAWLFDVDDASWSQLASIDPMLNFGYGPTGREIVFAATSGRTLMFSDGQMAELDATTATWTTYAAGELPPGVSYGIGPLYRLNPVLVEDSWNGRVLVFGGASRMDGGWEHRDDLWAYDPTTHTWTPVLDTVAPE